jgi:23S rRNA pseudouridine1911/1915/1917 synthase
VKVLKVSDEDAGKRADIIIAHNYNKFSRSSLENLFKNKLVSINGKFLKPSHRVKVDDKLRVDDSDIGKAPPKIELPMIYEDDNVTVINKPAGVLTHSKGAFNNEASVATFIKDKLSDEFPENNRAGIVHRLDRATSGVIITAKNPKTLSLLQKQFSLRKTKKKYLAIVAGSPVEKTAIIEVPIERNPRAPQSFRPGVNGKSASTEYRVIKNFFREDKEYSLVELLPKTGRTHQLRVHMSYIGTPIVGDRVYEGEPADHMYLHARELEITIPEGNRRVFSVEQPNYFKDFIDGK